MLYNGSVASILTFVIDDRRFKRFQRLANLRIMIYNAQPNYEL
jgi:hypothetical protein